MVRCSPCVYWRIIKHLARNGLIDVHAGEDHRRLELYIFYQYCIENDLSPILFIPMLGKRTVSETKSFNSNNNHTNKTNPNDESFSDMFQITRINIESVIIA